MFRRQAIVWTLVIASTAARAAWAQPTGVQGGVVGGLQQPPPPPPPPPPPAPIRVGSGIRTPAKVKDVRPVYPAIAQSARVQGVVVIEATIGADGAVRDARVLRSIPLLDAAALDAVRQWVYEPTMLNGVAVPVIMTVTVNFSLMESVKLKITDRSGVVTVVEDPAIVYGVPLSDVNAGGPASSAVRDGIRTMRGNASVDVKWSLVDSITFSAAAPGTPSRIPGEILLKSGERTQAEFLVPAAGGALRGKTSAGDYAIALKDVATIVPVATPRTSSTGNPPPGVPPPSTGGSGIGPAGSSGSSGVRRPDGTYTPGNGVTLPRVVREVRPQYTSEAMKAKIQGAVFLECVVLPDGSVGDVRVTKSLDSTFGLDESAIKAAKQWRFEPGTREGVPVPVVISIELTFTLGNRPGGN